MVVKTFRGLLAAGGQDRIRLQTIKGKVGYRIVKYDIITTAPGSGSEEDIMKIYKEEQSTINAIIDFTDSSLLGVAYSGINASGWLYSENIIFDNEVFNQDIFIVHGKEAGSGACNYYIELEVIPLDDAGAEYTTLKDMRQG